MELIKKEENMSKDQFESLKKFLDKGMTLIEARKLDKSLRRILFEDTDCKYINISKNHYPDDYFDDIHDGVEFFKPDKLAQYKELPEEGIILKDGTIYRVDTYHMEVSCWLKCNGIDLDSNLRYVYFRDTKNLVITEGYDTRKKFDETNILKLCNAWNDFYDNENQEYSTELTEPQAITLFYLAKQYSYTLDEVTRFNKCLKTDWDEVWGDIKSRRIGAYNRDTIDKALKKIPMCDIYDSISKSNKRKGCDFAPTPKR